MVDSPSPELVEVDVEVLSYVPGQRADTLGRARRFWDVAVAEPTSRAWPAVRVGAATLNLAGDSSFWRIVDVPGDQLERVLGAWWSRAVHDDGHLRLGEPRGDRGVWELGGSMRITPMSRRFDVEVRLASYARFWSMLELSPRHQVRPTRPYFRVGHDSLDRFIAALRAFT